MHTGLDIFFPRMLHPLGEARYGLCSTTRCAHGCVAPRPTSRKTSAIGIIGRARYSSLFAPCPTHNGSHSAGRPTAVARFNRLVRRHTKHSVSIAACCMNTPCAFAFCLAYAAHDVTQRSVDLYFMKPDSCRWFQYSTLAPLDCSPVWSFLPPDVGSGSVCAAWNSVYYGPRPAN